MEQLVVVAAERTGVDLRPIRELDAGNLRGSRTLAELQLRWCELGGELRNSCRARVDLACLNLALGAYDEAVVLLRAACTDASQMGLENVLPIAQGILAQALGHRGALMEARALAVQAVAMVEAQDAPRAEGATRATLSWVLQALGELEEAEAEARRAVNLLEETRLGQVFARGMLAKVLLARGRPREALAESSEAMALLESRGRVDYGEALARLVHAEALDATGDHAAACLAITEARDRLLAQTAQIDDASHRKTFLEDVPEHARTLALALQWVSEPAPE